MKHILFMIVFTTPGLAGATTGAEEAAKDARNKARAKEVEEWKKCE
jgi:hypothetical protein